MTIIELLELELGLRVVVGMDREADDYWGEAHILWRATHPGCRV